MGNTELTQEQAQYHREKLLQIKALLEGYSKSAQPDGSITWADNDRRVLAAKLLPLLEDVK